jgi:ABC-type branched-subunit amino acid transport system ATPase component
VAELQDELDEIEVSRRRTHAESRDVLLELRGVTAEGERTEIGLIDVSLDLHEGEILGVAGVDGNGQRALAEVVAGQRPATQGEVLLFGGPVTRMSVAARQKLGLRYVTDDRLEEGVVRALPVAINLFLKRIGQRPFWRRGRIQRAVVDERAAELVREFEIRTPAISTRVGALSGGNIQKVLLARELLRPEGRRPTSPPTGSTSDDDRSASRSDGSPTAAAARSSSRPTPTSCSSCPTGSRCCRAGASSADPNGHGAAEDVGRMMVGGEEVA